MKITIIADNYVDTACLMAEHGFSCLVESNGKKILFDTGQGQVLLNNMQALGVVKDIDMIVLSHGHYDHTGGFSEFFNELAFYSKHIYASEHIFDLHLKKNGNDYSFIGFGTDQYKVEKHYKLHMNSEFTEISTGIYLSGSIKRFEEFDADKLLYSNIDGEFTKDMFRDEQYLVVRVEGGIHVITGCTHCGAVNMLMDVKEKFPDDMLLSVTGGLHMFRSDGGQVDHVVDFFEKESVKHIYTGHCTGLEAAMHMKNRLGDRVSITKAGMTINI